MRTGSRVVVLGRGFARWPVGRQAVPEVYPPPPHRHTDEGSLQARPVADLRSYFECELALRRRTSRGQVQVSLHVHRSTVRVESQYSHSTSSPSCTSSST